MSETSWQRWVAETHRQAPGIALSANVGVNVVKALLLTCARLEGGWGDEPGVGDGGLSFGWPQLYTQFDAGRSWQPHGAHLIHDCGWTIDDLLNERKVVGYWGPLLAANYARLDRTGKDEKGQPLPAGEDQKVRYAIFETERPREIYSEKAFGNAYQNARRIIAAYRGDAAPVVNAAQRPVEAAQPSKGGGAVIGAKQSKTARVARDASKSSRDAVAQVVVQVITFGVSRYLGLDVTADPEIAAAIHGVALAVTPYLLRLARQVLGIPI